MGDFFRAFVGDDKGDDEGDDGVLSLRGSWSYMPWLGLLDVLFLLPSFEPTARRSGGARGALSRGIESRVIEGSPPKTEASWRGSPVGVGVVGNDGLRSHVSPEPESIS